MCQRDHITHRPPSAPGARGASQRPPTLIAILALVAAIVVLTGLLVAGRSYLDPDHAPLLVDNSCLAANLERGPPASAKTIRQVSLAGVHLGMPIEEARRALATNSVVRTWPQDQGVDVEQLRGHAAWKDVYIAYDIRAGSTGQQSIVPPDASTLVIGAGPDAQGRIVVTRLKLQTADPDRSARSSLLSDLNRILGKPSSSYQSPRKCYGFPVVAYGSDSKVDDIGGLFTFENCRSLGVEVSEHDFVCDRAKALRSPWIAEVSNTSTSWLLIEDGELSYATRYPILYAKSVIKEAEHN